jgi:hypothetical protein
MENDLTETFAENIPELKCDNCQTLKPLIYPASHFLHASLGILKGMLCSECADTEEKREIPIGMIQPILENTPLDQPLSGKFSAILVPPDDPGTGANQYWMDIGLMVLEELATWKDKVMKFSFGGQRYKGLWLKPHWHEKRVIKISIAGDTPSKNLELDIYQQTRLAKFGFQEEGKTNKIWSIDLNEVEGTVPNVSSIIIHILRFGYLLEPSDLNRITPTLDVDFSDPVYKKP